MHGAVPGPKRTVTTILLCLKGKQRKMLVYQSVKLKQLFVSPTYRTMILKEWLRVAVLRSLQWLKEAKKSHPSKNKKLVDDDAMQVWASILDFEEDGLLDLDPQSLFSEMFGHMQADMRRLIGPVTKWLERMIHEK